MGRINSRTIVRDRNGQGVVTKACIYHDVAVTAIVMNNGVLNEVAQDKVKGGSNRVQFGPIAANAYPEAIGDGKRVHHIINDL
ncbi:MAG: hypothetical protein ACK5KM_08015, partial [Hyphomicrobiaceae bacterium]